jgi:four helix bundle protein
VAGLRDHEAFDVWQLSDEVRRRVRLVLQRRELQREFKLRDQLSSAAEGPCGHIAEGFSRWFPNDFARFVRIAKGSLSEVIVHIGAARDRGLVTDAECQDINRYARRARGAATALIRYLESANPPNQKPNDAAQPHRKRDSEEEP